MTNTLTDLTLTGDLTMDANDIVIAGDLASAATPCNAGWFTNLNVTNPISASITGNAATVTTNANLSGPITSVGNTTSIASQTGTGSKFVVDSSPTIVTPNISVINAPSSSGVSVQGRTDGAGYASGYVGETISSPSWAAGDNVTATVTITIASPAVISFANHGLSTGAGVNFTTTGALPTGISVGTNYYVIKIDNNSFWIATSVANALAGTKVNTSGTQSGTHTCAIYVLLQTGVYTDANGLQLPAGLWLVNAVTSVQNTSGTTMTIYAGQITLTSATTTPFGNTGFMIVGGQSMPNNTGALFPTGSRVLNLSSTTNVYGIVRGTFTSGTARGACSIVATRIG